MVKFDRDSIVKNYESAKKTYASFNVDTDKVLKNFKEIPISLHCWQGDDVTGFEKTDAVSQNLVTGNYPGKARNAAELRADIDKVFSLSPSKNRLNLHSIYAEPKKPVSRENLTADDFANWISWAKENNCGLDYNGSFFTHPMMKDGLSLSSPDKKVRDFWIRHGVTSRQIAAEMGKALKTPCIHNVWIPDGLKDLPASRLSFRQTLKDSLDEVFAQKMDKKLVVDVLESKLFQIGAESFVVGSHEFYMGYAKQNNIGVCLDTGHFHPTEYVGDKLSSLSLFYDNILLHVSRGVRWDSDHVVTFNDEVTGIMSEIKRGNLFNKVAIGLDYFDATINRVGAWVIGLRAASRALLQALLEPTEILLKAEADWNLTERLAYMEEFKALPLNAVWDYLCMSSNVPVSSEWIDELRTYETNVQSKR